MQGSLFRIERSWFGGEGLVFVGRVRTRETERRGREKEKERKCVLCVRIYIFACVRVSSE